MRVSNAHATEDRKTAENRSSMEYSSQARVPFLLPNQMRSCKSHGTFLDVHEININKSARQHHTELLFPIIRNGKYMLRNDTSNKRIHTFIFQLRPHIWYPFSEPLQRIYPAIIN